MAEVLLFHHVLGLTPGVMAFADSLRAAGHVVRAPDLFDGRRFDTIEAGAAHVDAIGMDQVIARGVAAADGSLAGTVCAGFSLGVVPAQYLAQTQPGVSGALLIEACLPPTEFGVAWPPGLAAQVHGMSADPFFAGEGDLDAARALAEEHTQVQLFLYDGSGHLFAEPGGPSFDPPAAALLLERVLAFLADR